jgi:putative endonuclease
MVQRHPEGRERASAFFSLRVALRDLLFSWKKSLTYMMGSTSRHVLYTGVTAFLYLRVWQHKNNQGGYFTSKYKCYRLVYFEQFTNVEVAIAREKKSKAGVEKRRTIL